jgi:hypothetical protein
MPLEKPFPLGSVIDSPLFTLMDETFPLPPLASKDTVNDSDEPVLFGSSQAKNRNPIISNMPKKPLKNDLFFIKYPLFIYKSYNTPNN